VPPRNDLILINGLLIQVHEKGFQEALLHDDLMCLRIEWVLAHVEDLGPQKLLKFEIFLCDQEERLRWVAVDLVEDSIGYHLLKDAFIAFALQEELVALRVGDNVVEKHADLVAKALIILFVALAKNKFKWGDQRRNDFWMNSKLMDSFLAANFNQVPKGFNRKRDNVRSEVSLLVDDPDEVTTDSLCDDLLRNRLVNADCSQCFEHTDHSVSRGASH
jgi:hypothetical protein